MCNTVVVETLFLVSELPVEEKEWICQKRAMIMVETLPTKGAMGRETAGTQGRGGMNAAS